MKAANDDASPSETARESRATARIGRDARSDTSALYAGASRCLAAAIADGMPPLEVANHGLFRRRDSDTIYRWLARYRLEGVDGLGIRSGRGRKPAFFPSVC